ncbi:MAG TPA: spore germination protein [Bacillales bacterium]
MKFKRKRHIKKLHELGLEKKKNTVPESSSDQLENASSLSSDLSENLKNITEKMGNSEDLVIREWTSEADETTLRVAAVYLSGLVDESLVNDFVSKSLPSGTSPGGGKSPFLEHRGPSSEKLRVLDKWETLITEILSGNTIMLADGSNEAVSGNTTGGKTRNISSPNTQLVIRGPQEAFNETISTNIALIRRRIKSPNLRIEAMRIGKVTQTEISLMYIEGIVNTKVLKEVKRRLHDIEIDGILESGYIEQLIQDQTFTPFPTIYNTERPDVVVGNLLEGRVAILVDGTPFVLVVPAVFVQFFQSPTDYYQHFLIASFLRLLRLLAFLFTMLIPAMYIALTTFHQEMIPTTLVISLAAQHEGVPFPAFVEAMLMAITFEILREAGIRMPRAVGQAVSIVGALVLGEAAVQAGIISAAMVIVVSLTGIASFAVPAYNITVTSRLIRFAMMILAATFGFYGVVLGLIITIGHMCSLRSFGIPYLTPFAPMNLSDLKDTWIRAPLWMLKDRQSLINHKNLTRQGRNQKPSPRRGTGNH